MLIKIGRKALTKAIYDEVCRARRCVPSGTGLGEADKLLHLIDTYLDDEGTLESCNKQQDSLLERLRNAPISAVRDEQAINALGWACAHIPLVLYERADAITALNDLEDFGGNWTVTFDLEASRKKQLKRLSAAVQSGTKRPLTLTFPNGRDRISGLAC